MMYLSTKIKTLLQLFLLFTLLFFTLKANTNLQVKFEKIDREQNNLLNTLYQEKIKRKQALALATLKADEKERKRLEEEAYLRLVAQDVAKQKAKELEIQRITLEKAKEIEAQEVQRAIIYKQMEEEIALLKKQNETLQSTMQENLKAEAIRKEAEIIQKKSIEERRLMYAREQAQLTANNMIEATLVSQKLYNTKQEIEKISEEKAKQEAKKRAKFQEKKEKEERAKRAKIKEQQRIALAKQTKMIAQAKVRLAQEKQKEAQRKKAKQKKEKQKKEKQKKLAKKKKSKKTKQQHITAHIDISKQRMKVFKGKKLLYVWRVSTARKGYKTATGTYKAQRIKKMHYSSLYHNSPMPYTIFYHGNYAIHGTRSVRKLGRPASHGCVRLHTKNAKKLYTLVNKNGKNNMSIKIVP